jgi:hypothetical protein
MIHPQKFITVIAKIGNSTVTLSVPDVVKHDESVTAVTRSVLKAAVVHVLPKAGMLL